MAKTGPPRKPTILKLLDGNPGHQKINKREPRGVGHACDLPCPDYLVGASRDEWARLVDTCPWLTASDRPAVEGAAVSYSIYRQALAQVEQSGPVQVSGGGYQCVNGWYAVMNKSLTHYLRCCQELGATPASRSRVELPDDNNSDELEEWQKNGN